MDRSVNADIQVNAIFSKFRVHSALFQHFQRVFACLSQIIVTVSSFSCICATKVGIITKMLIEYQQRSFKYLESILSDERMPTEIKHTIDAAK